MRVVSALGAARRPSVKKTLLAATALDQSPLFRPGQFDVICIGSSTGGPPVLESIISSLPADMNTPIIIAQHMPQVFTRFMAERLNDLCTHRVIHAENWMPLERGTIYVAHSGMHLHLKKLGLARWNMCIDEEPKHELYRPSANVLFETAAEATSQLTLAIVLNGIGEDGVIGARHLRDKGETILAQNAKSCVVYGMPKAVTQAALVTTVLDPAGINKSLATLASSISDTRAKAG